MEHAPFAERPGQGENLAWMSGISDFDTASSTMTQAWYDEVSDYDFSNPGFTPLTGKIVIFFQGKRYDLCKLSTCNMPHVRISSWFCCFF